MLKRAISGVILLAVLITVVWKGGLLLVAFLCLLSLVGMQELFSAFSYHPSEENKDFRFVWTPCTILAMGAAVAYDVFLYFKESQMLSVVAIFMVLALLTILVLAFPRIKTEEVIAAFFSFFYVTVLLSCIYLVRIDEHGRVLVWLIFLGSWGADTCAYLAGRFFGKHKLAPVLSPKKTVEGAVGGILGSALLAALFAVIFRQPVLPYILITAAVSVVSMIGDLAASAMKRAHGVKDYGKLIPGHGGVLDRFDSVLFAAPVVYALSLVVPH